MHDKASCTPVVNNITADKLVYQLCVDEGNGCRERVRANDEGLTLETSAIVSFTASITLINTQLIHQFVSCHADAITYNPRQNC